MSQSPWFTRENAYNPGAQLAQWNRSQRTRMTILGDSVTEPGHGRIRITHGTTSAYRFGCGCERCRAANRDAQRRKRARS